jgi:hypothetical protein
MMAKTGHSLSRAAKHVPWPPPTAPDAQRLPETTVAAIADGISDYQESAPSHYQGSGYEQAETELCRVEVDQVAVALGPPA